MITFFTFLFYFFLSLIILGFISRILLKLWLRRVFRKINQNDKNYYQDNSYSNNNPQPKKKIIDRNEGDYIDYEEVK